MKKVLFLFTSFGFSLCAFSSNSDSVIYYLQQAKNFKQEKRVPEAEKNFLKAIDFDPSDYSTRMEYGNFLLDQRKYLNAAEQYKMVLQSTSNTTSALQKMTEVSFLMKRWKDVMLYAGKITGEKKGEGISYMLGRAYYEEEDYGVSEKMLVQAIKESPSNAEAVSLLGKVYIELSNYKQAIEVYNKAISLDQNNNKLVYELGLLYYTINKEQEAVKYFELAAQKGYKTDLDYKENLGMACLGFDVQKGVEILNSVLLKKPNEPEIMTQIAQAYYKAKNFKEAADTFNKIYLNDDSNNKALYMIGLSYIKMGEKDKGASICEKAIQLDPKLAELKRLGYGH